MRGRTAPARRIDILAIPENTSSTNETQIDDTNDLDIQTVPTEENFSEYDINSDIEELFKRSQRYEEDQEERYERKKKDKSQRHSKKKRRSRRTVRYSLSKPASPETEQIIRVDVTSSIPLDDLEEPGAISKLINLHIFILFNVNFFSAQDSDVNSTSMKLNNEFMSLKNINADEEDCLIKCKQLVLTPK